MFADPLIIQDQAVAPRRLNSARFQTSSWSQNATEKAFLHKLLHNNILASINVMGAHEFYLLHK